MARIDTKTSVIVVPGLGGSASDHWQSHFQRAIPGASRIDVANWERPDLCEWTDSLLSSVRRHPDSLLVAHSLGCALIAHVAQRHPNLPVRGALLVAPADVDASQAIPQYLCSFTGMPRQPLPFPSMMVASRNDPYMSFQRAEMFATVWNSTLLDIGAAGHINIESGFGPWPDGRRLLSDFIHRLDPGERNGRDQPHQHFYRTGSDQ